MSKKNKKAGSVPSAGKSGASAHGTQSKTANAAKVTSAILPDWAVLAACLALTFAVFANTLNAGFVNWDDHGYLWLNPMVQPLANADIAGIFSGDTHGNYSPLVILTYCFEHSFDHIVKPGQMSVENFQPFLYHLDNVLLHLGATALVFFLLRAMGIKGWGLAFGTALFGIHPMRVESVAWITERKDVLYGLFYIAALLNYWKYIQNGQGKYYGYTLLFGLLSLFSKIQAVSLPLSMLAMDWLATRTAVNAGSGRDLKNMKVWLEKLPFFALSLIFGLIGIHFLGQAEGLKETGYSMMDRFFFATTSLVRYLWKVPAPFGLSAYYPYPKLGTIPALFYASPIILAAIGWWVWGSLKKGSTLAFGFLFFLVNIVFVLQFKGAGKAFMADRFTYIPYFGLFFVLAKWYADIESGRLQSGLKTVMPVLAAGFIGLCAVLTVMQNGAWKSSIALWENNTARHPEDALSWSNLGLAYDDLQQYEKSMQAYEQAIKVDPVYFDASFNLAVALSKLKRYEDSAKMFGRAIEIKPDYADAWFGRAQALMNKGDNLKAIPDIEKAGQLGLKDGADRVQAALGMAYAGAGQHEQAIAAFDQAIKLKADPDHYFKKGNSLASMGKMLEAIACYDESLRIAPDYAEAYNNKGNAFASMGKFAEALAAFDQAVKAKPDAPNFRCNRGMAKNSAGDRAGACQDWQQAAVTGYAPAQALMQQFCK